jgi:hypothetical protein
VSPQPRCSNRALGRATLSRQGLLEPITSVSIADAVRQVGSLQAQHTEWPPVALWSRAGDRAVGGHPAALADRSVVRAALMRITVHVVAADDFWPMSMLVQPLRRQQFRSFFKADPFDSPLGRQLGRGHAAVRAALAEGPLRIRDMDAIMRREVPRLADHPNRIYWRHLAASLPLVHVPFAGEGYGRSRYALADAWIGPAPTDLDEPAALRHLARRYLAAFGPATLEDLMAWAGRRGSPARWRLAVASLGDAVVPVRAEDGRELLDLVDGPRPDEATDAPPRLLARWDSLLLSHATAHRGRFIADEDRAAVYTKNADVLPTFVVDGMVAGTWEVNADRTEATIRPFRVLRRAARDVLVEQASRLLAVLAPGSAIHVRFVHA